MKIYNADQTLLLEVEVDDNSYRNRAIMGEDNLILYYSLAEHVEVPVGAYCIFEGRTYTLLRPQDIKMEHTRNFAYTVTFSADQDKAKKWKFRNTVDGRLRFSLTAKPHEHLQMFIDNMNRRDSGWTIGECITDTEKLVTYDHDYCYTALSKIASAFETEYEINGKQVSLHKVEYNKNNPLALSYGKGNGLKPGVGRSNSGDTPAIEILYVQGGDRNIDRSKYPEDKNLRATSNGCLLLPVGQTLAYDGEHFEDEQGFVAANARHYKVDNQGLSITNTDRTPSSYAEDSLDRSDDYPKRVGTISSVVAVDAKQHFYDFVDASIPPNLDYSKCVIGGDKMSVVFQSGELAGREFDVKYYHEAVGDKAARRFEIVPQEIDGVTMPGGTFLPKADNTYAVFGCMLPQSYICDNDTKSGASWNMFRNAVKYLYDNEDTKFTFTGELDGIWAKKDWTNIGAKIRLGGFVRFTDARLAPDGVLIRITGIKDYINNPHAPKIELSNETFSGSVATTIKTIESATEVSIDESRRDAIQFTKRRFRDAKETMEMLEAALADNFSKRINPIVVETMQMLVGDESLQFRFVQSVDNPTTAAHSITWDVETKKLTAQAGIIQHMTLGIKTLSAEHKPTEYRYWSVDAFESAALEDASAKYYLYIRAARHSISSPGAAIFRLETTPHALSDGNYYWLLVGILNSEYDGERSFATLYGYTEILPGRITTERVTNADGDAYFDLQASAFKLKDRLDFNTAGDGELRLKGTIVQSRGGEVETPLGCFRGEYNATYTYYYGDDVTYQPEADQPTSTYRCISTTPISNIWPTDTSKWQVIAQGVAGEPGAPGIHPAAVYRGYFRTGQTYYGNTNRVDIVKSGSTYYIAKADAPNGTGGFSGTAVAPPNPTYWLNFGASFDSVATALLLAENANIANLIFRNERLESTAQTNGVPNFYLDGLQNVASFAAGNVRFDGASAKIGWLYIDGKDLVGIDNTGIERIRITPNALPSATAAGTTEILVIKAYGGNAEYTGETDTEVSFTYQAAYDDSSEIPVNDTMLSAYVEYDIAEASTRIDLSQIQHTTDLKDGTGQTVTPTTIRCSAMAYRQVGSAWDFVTSASISDGQLEVTLPKAGRYRIWITLEVYAPAVSEWSGQIGVSAQGITAKTAKEEFFAAKDGVMAIYNGNYFRFDSTDGFVARVGNYGMLINSAGIKKMTDGKNWHDF